MVAWPTEASLISGLAIQEFLKHERRKFKKRGWRVIALVDTRTARLDEGVYRCRNFDARADDFRFGRQS
jgi:hypothetical protein